MCNQIIIKDMFKFLISLYIFFYCIIRFKKKSIELNGIHNTDHEFNKLIQINLIHHHINVEKNIIL